MSRTVKFAAALLSASALIAIAAPASADIVTMSARQSVGNGGATDSASYVAAWNAVLAAQPTPPAGYADQTIADWNGGQSNQYTGGGVSGDLAYHDHVVFNAGSGGLFAFRFGIDFGLGGTLLLDGLEVETNTNDMWWAGSYADPSQFLKGVAVLSAGNHTFDLYGFEHCCDGGTQGQWSKGTDGIFHDFVTTSGGVPEPASWALMITGFGLAGATLRRRRATAVTA